MRVQKGLFRRKASAVAKYLQGLSVAWALTGRNLSLLYNFIRQGILFGGLHFSLKKLALATAEIGSQARLVYMAIPILSDKHWLMALSSVLPTPTWKFLFWGIPFKEQSESNTSFFPIWLLSRSPTLFLFYILTHTVRCILSDECGLISNVPWMWESQAPYICYEMAPML